MITTILALATLASAPSSTEMTVYNGGYAFIKEIREIELKGGVHTVNVEDVASSIDPTSVGIKGLAGPGFSILEQNYKYDLISPAAILAKATGQRVMLTRFTPAGKDVLEGTLLNAPSAVTPDGNQFYYQGLVIKTDDGRIILNPSGEVTVMSMPSELIAKPTLSWLLESDVAGKQSIQMSYLSSGLSWDAGYVMMLGKPTEKAKLQSWVTLTNNSGTTFKDAKLKLLAGDVNRAPQGGIGGAGAPMMEMMAKASRAADNFKEEGLGEYHLYTLGRPATVANREIKQLSLLDASGISYEKKMVIDSMEGFYQYYPNEGEVGVGNLKPSVFVEFKNSKENGLGIALPRGKFKVYANDSSGSSQMLGEDWIDHTPKDEKIKIKLGQAFDIRGSRKRTEFSRISSNEVSETFELEVRNRKDTPETVYVYERHWGDWKVTKTSMEFTKADSNTMVYKVDLGANATKKVTYTVRTRW